MFRTRLLILIAAFATIVLAPAAARADDPWGDVDCKAHPNDPQCTVVVIDPGSGGGGGDGDGGGSLTCKLGGEVVPCYSEAWGWLGSDGCYYGKDGGGFLPEQWYIRLCYDPASGNMNFEGTVFLDDPPLTLAILAQRAVSQLKMPRPVIATNPGLDSPQVVHVPVWWWVQPGLWKTHTATASLPGITITARAEPTKITWYAGDGSSTVCRGPGTPWTGSASPLSKSDCSHTYTTTSREASGGKFTLRAVVIWHITWAGGGFSGTEPPATTADQASIEVTESLPVITG
ncbi:hypothetical protein [Micromonospora sp. WMMD1082]|uniref:hypothetical protein n=1 Tax=Micromonospora sp. WMMD1082 TaxID=3016104 RepID=UPI0024170C0D|nr:hypothetical protein [Micromonospora sp. WMMD1082]MDG4793614.1 hypothetical protein [Micromonospora sp. WMMD1082]